MVISVFFFIFADDIVTNPFQTIHSNNNNTMRKILFGLGMAYAITASAQNPFVQTWFTSDPAPLVHDGTMYVYTGHDEDNADFFWMQEWRVYSTQDMVNWQDHV